MHKSKTLRETKLVLKHEAIRVLNVKSLVLVAGGVTTSVTSIGSTCPLCGPTSPQ